jgi:hypothetical protein
MPGDTDEGAGLVCGVEVTTANLHDAGMLDVVLPPEPGDGHANSRPANPLPDREGLRHMEAQPWLAADAMARTG